MDPLTALAAFAPLLIDAGKGLIARFIAPDTFKPASIAEWLQMRDSDTKLFEIMNSVGSAGTSYPWVEAIIKLQRPAVAIVVLSVWAWAHASSMHDTATIDNFAAVIGFYLFGDRTLFKAKQIFTGQTVKGST